MLAMSREGEPQGPLAEVPLEQMPAAQLLIEASGTLSLLPVMAGGAPNRERAEEGTKAVRDALRELCPN
jgi:hypothetical protein